MFVSQTLLYVNVYNLKCPHINITICKLLSKYHGNFMQITYEIVWWVKIKA